MWIYTAKWDIRKVSQLPILYPISYYLFFSIASKKAKGTFDCPS